MVADSYYMISRAALVLLKLGRQCPRHILTCVWFGSNWICWIFPVVWPAANAVNQTLCDIMVKKVLFLLFSSLLLTCCWIAQAVRRVSSIFWGTKYCSLFSVCIFVQIDEYVFCKFVSICLVKLPLNLKEYLIFFPS